MDIEAPRIPVRTPLLGYTPRKAPVEEIEGTAVEVGDEPAELTEKQVAATIMLSRNPARWCCLVGGARSGKTVALLRAVLFRAHRAASRHVILRFHVNTVWTSVGDQSLPWVLKTFFPHTEVIVHRSAQMFELPEFGSQIFLGGLDEKDRTEKVLASISKAGSAPCR
jgi:hypothetical protein